MDMMRIGDQDESTIAEIAATLPDNEAGMIEQARQAIAAFDRAVMRGDSQAATQAADRYDAVTWRLNNGTFFGCRSSDVSAGSRVERACSKAPGEVPGWGQKGAFVVSVNGMRAIVETHPHSLRYAQWLNFHAIDLERRFLSETGFRSHLQPFTPGVTIQQAARDYIAASQAGNHYGVAIREPHTLSQVIKARQPWVRRTLCDMDEPVSYQENDGQLGMII